MEPEDPIALNPYAPPVQDSRESVPDVYEGGRLFRDGHFLVVLEGAEFPNRCFATGHVTDKKFLWTHAWHSPWINLLLIAILPYLVLAPLLSMRVRFEVPIHASILHSHLRLVRIGFRLLVVAAACFLVLCTASLVSFYPKFLLFFLLVAVLIGLGGFFLSSREPIPLRIAKIEGGAVYLAGVHPACLSGLREYAGVR